MSELPFHRDRPDAKVSTPLTLAQLEDFDAVLDARSPSEYAEDHLPGALNMPVLDDEQRALVGTVYKQQSAFEAKRVGAPLAARNIADHIERHFAAMPRSWRPLVYCWRGGGRSGSLVHVLRQVGWDAQRLDGGYKAFRRQVAAELQTMPAAFRYHVICGATGSGKSRLLEALQEAGAQVLDLELLAAHRGSVLGELPGEPQPTQKSFETALWTRLARFDAKRPVYVESESKKVGNLRVPDALIVRMRESRCFRLEAQARVRVALHSAGASTCCATCTVRSGSRYGRRTSRTARGSRWSTICSRATTIRPIAARSSATTASWSPYPPRRPSRLPVRR